MAPITRNIHDLGPVPHPPFNKVSDDQATVEAHLLKDLIEPGAEDGATASGFHKFYKKTTSADINALTIPVKIPETTLKFDNLFGYRPAIS